MDRSRFTENKLGELVEITHPRADASFIPAPLNVKWPMPTTLWPILAEAREALARLDGVGRHLPNHQLLLVPLQQREALRSSSMEGTYATPEELLLYQIDPRDPASDEDRVNEWREVLNYGKALQLGVNLLEKGTPLSLRLIREMHNTLLSGVRGQQRRPGVFRDCQVHIGAGGRFVPPPPLRLQECLDDFEKYHHQPSDLDPLVRAFMAHYQFETIHPFRDGNGRVGRLLLSLTIYTWMKLSSPWLYMSAFFERHKDEYIDRLFMVSANGEWERWIEFCLKGVVDQSSDAVERIDKLVDLRDRYTAQAAESGGSARLQVIVDKLFESPVITAPQIRDLTGVSYPTAQADIRRLVDINILKKGDPDAYPQYHFSPEIIEIAYADN